ASDQADAGVVSYDISDPTAPVLLDHINGSSSGIGGYWTELWRHFLVFPRRKNDGAVFIVDYSDPTDLRFVQELTVGGNPMYAQFQDDHAFIENNKIDLAPLLDDDPATGAAIVLELDEEGTGIDTSQFGLPVGNLWITGGIQGGDKKSQGAAIWIHDSEPDTTGPSIAYHVPRDGQQHYSPACPITLLVHETIETADLINGETIILRPVGGGEPVDCDLTYSFNDILSLTPRRDLDPGVTYEVLLTTDACTDAVGNPLQDVTGPGDTFDGRDIAYRFSFTTDDGSDPRPVIDDVRLSSASPMITGTSLTITVDASDDDPLEYRIDYGDGDQFSRNRSEWGSTTSFTHTYTTPGSHRITVQVRGVGTITRLATRVVPITVHEPVPDLLPQNSGTVAVDADRRRFWTVNPDNDSVALIDSDARTRVGAPIPVGDHPAGVAIDADGEAWVVCRDDDSIHILAPDGSPVTVLAVPYGSRPDLVVSDPTGSTLYVATHGDGRILRFDAATNSALAALPERSGLNMQMFVGHPEDGALPFSSLDELDPHRVWKPKPNNTRLSIGVHEGGLDLEAAREFHNTFARNDDRLNYRTRKLSSNFGIVYRGLLQVDEPGTYTFHITVNDAARLRIGGQLVAEVDGVVGSRDRREISGGIELSVGRHPLELRFMEVENSEHLSVEWEGPGIARSVVPAARLWPEQEVRRHGALAIGPDGILYAAQLVSDDHAGRIARFDTVGGRWLPSLWLLRDTFTDDTGAQSRGVPNYLRGLALSFDGSRAWYGGKKDNILVGRFVDGEDPTFETSIRALVGPLDLRAEDHLEAEPQSLLGKLQRLDIDNHALPAAIRYGPLGTKIFLALQANNRLLVLDAATGSQLDQVDTGLAPDGIAIDPVTNIIAVKNLMDRSLQLFDGDELIGSGVRSLGSGHLLATIATVDAEALPATVLRGKQLFYSARDIDPLPAGVEEDRTSTMTTDGYISCAVCHLDGGHDGRT
ncbi:MAG: PA14 domain-containing protein, partial [Planctomycetota bacterium]